MLCLGTYLTAIRNNKLVTVTQKNILGRIMLAIDSSFPASDDALISNLRRGKKNPSEYTIEAAQKLAQDESLHPEYISKFQEVLSYIDPNKKDSLKQELIQVIMNDDKIHGTTVVDIVNNIDKDHISETRCSLDSILAGILLYVLTATKHRTGKQSTAQFQDKSNNQTAPVQSVPSANEEAISTESEDVFRVAQDFCLKYEKELGLLPLCQIAFNIDPLHNNVRNMYTDYIRCPKKVKETLLRIKGIPQFTFTKDWVDKAIDHYESLVEQYELSTKEFLYDGAKYLHKAFYKYSAIEIDNPNPYIFERPSKTQSNQFYFKDCLASIGYYIIDYLWYKQNEPSHYVQPPMDYLWYHCNLGGCDEPEMTFWVCRFIISSSFHICEDDQDIEDFWKSVSIDEQLLKTLEDMYYYALLQIYLLTLTSDDLPDYEE